MVRFFSVGPCQQRYVEQVVKERYCLTVVTCLHVRTPQAGYLATSGKVSDNSEYCLAFACCSALIETIITYCNNVVNT
ncbi:hypothetical protein [Arsenophonus sp.]|uniref:hypothetical protein n=1 Tax=Arsenophonus sp. TaxID=1872640 RepID=UPI0028604EC1|nr:hypothetical protein [Arsenophonus sp.]MDR5616814.1 hypothetical protein [Arsenophonus sp.]